MSSCNPVQLPYPTRDYSANILTANKISGQQSYICSGNFQQLESDTINVGGISAVDIDSQNINTQTLFVDGIPITGVTSSPNFPDSNAVPATSAFRIHNAVNTTSFIEFDASHITVGATRIFSAPDLNGILPGIVNGTTLVVGDTNYPLLTATGSTLIGISAGGSLTSGTNNTAIGSSALTSMTTGFTNVAVGNNTLQLNVTGTGNVAVGSNALQFNTGSSLTAVGVSALGSNTTGSPNTAVGALSMSSNTTGTGNVAVGDGSLQSNTIGFGNTAVGSSALSLNVNGHNNTALGSTALGSNVNGIDNTAVGLNALSLSTVDGNTAVGAGALESNTTGTPNTAIGNQSLLHNVSGTNNVAVGDNTLLDNTTGTNNTAIGSGSLFSNISGSNNTAIGSGTLNTSTGNSNTVIGSNTLTNAATDSGTIIIGQGVTGTVGAVSGTGSNVITIKVPTANVGLFCNAVRVSAAAADSLTYDPVTFEIVASVSSQKLKKDIKPLTMNTTELLSKFRPVTYLPIEEPDNSSQYEIGLIAEEVETFFPEMLVRNNNGEIHGLKYKWLHTLLLKDAIQKNEIIGELKEKIKFLQEQIDKVSGIKLNIT